MIGRAIAASRAFVYIGWQVSISYPLSFVMDQLVSLVPVFVYYFVSDLVAERATTGGDYFTFAVVGILVTRMLSAGLRGVAEAIEEAINQGHFEALLTQPVSWTLLPFGLVQWPIIWRLVNAGVLAVLALGLGADLRLAGVPGALAIIALGTSATIAVGVMAAAVKILARRTEPIITVYSIAATMLAGVYYPLDVLPGPLAALSRALPDTYALSALRRLLLPSSEGLVGPSVAEAAVVLVGFNLVLFPLSVWAFRRSLDFGRRMGVLGGY